MSAFGGGVPFAAGIPFAAENDSAAPAGAPKFTVEQLAGPNWTMPMSAGMMGLALFLLPVLVL